MNNLMGLGGLGGLHNGAESEEIQKQASEIITKQVEDRIEDHRLHQESISESLKEILEDSTKYKRLLLNYINQAGIMDSAIRRMADRKDCPNYVIKAFDEASDLYHKVMDEY